MAVRGRALGTRVDTLRHKGIFGSNRSLVCLDCYGGYKTTLFVKYQNCILKREKLLLLHVNYDNKPDKITLCLTLT